MFIDRLTQLGTDIDEKTRQVLQAGARLLEALRQGRYQPLEDWKQALLLFSVSNGFASGVLRDGMEEYEKSLFAYFEEKESELVDILKTGNRADDVTLERIREALSHYVRGYDHVDDSQS